MLALDPDRAVDQYSVQVWNMEGGLPSNSVYAIQQTQAGYLWIGTQAGLVRFDGYNFELYTRETIPRLQCNEIRSLYQDQKGSLWIGTSSGGLTRYKDGEFTTYPVTEYKALSNIKAINEDRWGNLWIGSYTGGLTCFDGSQFTTYTTQAGLPHQQVNFIYKDSSRDLWVAAAAGIVKLLKPGTFQSYASQELLPYLKTTCLYEADERTLWIGTVEKGLFRLKNGRVTAYGTEAGIPPVIITYLYEDRMQNLWIGTDGGGLSRLRNGVVSTFPAGDELGSGWVYSIYEDREGSLWVGTLDGGLHQLRDSKFTTFTTREGLPHDYINCVYEGRDGDLWIGTKGGLNRLTRGVLTTRLTTREGLSDNSILCLFEDPSGYLWIGTWGGLHRFKEGRLVTLTRRDGLSDNRIRCIMGDKQGNIWIGSENGLNRFDSTKGELTVFTTKDGLSSSSIEFIFEDSRGMLWISTGAGLNWLKEGLFTTHAPAAGLEGHSLQCAFEDKAGTLWFGTNSGLIRLKGKGTTLYTVQCGLTENYVYSILEDERGYLWLGGRNGISRVRKKEVEDFAAGRITQVRPDTYNEKDGMKSRWCNGCGCKTRDGRFWFPTSVGIAVIDPNRLKKNNVAPSPIIEKLVVDGEPVNIPGRAGAKETMVLGAGKKRLEFYYTAVSFINPQKMRFKLKLVGYDSDWLDMGTLRSTTYTGLSAGNYTFKVTACNADGVWNKTGISFSFYLQPYFYQTTWFYLSVVLFVLLAAFSLHRFRVRQLRAREKELGALVQMRTSDLEERNTELEKAQYKLQQSKELIESKNLQLEEQAEKLKEMDKVKSRFFANISHEFRTPLTLIMGPLEQMLSGAQEGEQEQKKKIRLMLRNSQRLLNLINQLLDLSKFDSGKMKLQVVRQNILPFLKGIFRSFNILAEQHEIELSFQTEGEDITLYFDPEKLEEVICNLLLNAVKFTPAGGRITAAVRVKEALPGTKEEDFLEISVSDTGTGIPADYLAHIFDRFYQADSTYELHRKGSGIGLAIAKEIVELHHGTISVISRESKDSGSEFVIRLPLGDSHLKPGEIANLSTVPSRRDDAHKVLSPYILAQEEEEAEPELEGKDIAGEAGMQERDIILVVEDSADVREYVRGALASLYNVKEAKDGEEGMRKAREIIPDLILSDIMMPGLDGYELCRLLKNDAATSHIPIILLTAKAAEEDIIQGLETGADDYITKPFSTRILLARIQNLIDLRRHLQQRRQRQMSRQPVKICESPIDEDFMNELQELIEKRLSDSDLNVDELSKKLCMSHATLYRKVHALTGESPVEFIRSYRLKRAAELLEANFGNVTEVAFEVGFSSTAYFTKCFKEKFHQLPSTYSASESS